MLCPLSPVTPSQSPLRARLDSAPPFARLPSRAHPGVPPMALRKVGRLPVLGYRDDLVALTCWEAYRPDTLFNEDGHSEIDHTVECKVLCRLANYYHRIVRGKRSPVDGLFEFLTALVNSRPVLRVVGVEAHREKSNIFKAVLAKLTDARLQSHPVPAIIGVAMRLMPALKVITSDGLRVILSDHRSFALLLRERAEVHAWPDEESVGDAKDICRRIAMALEVMAVSEYGFVISLAR